MMHTRQAWLTFRTKVSEGPQLKLCSGLSVQPASDRAHQVGDAHEPAWSREQPQLAPAEPVLGQVCVLGKDADWMLVLRVNADAPVDAIIDELLQEHEPGISPACCSAAASQGMLLISAASAAARADLLLRELRA